MLLWKLREGQLSVIAAVFRIVYTFFAHRFQECVVKLVILVQLHKGQTEFIADRVDLDHKMTVRDAVDPLDVFLEPAPVFFADVADEEGADGGSYKAAVCHGVELFGDEAFSFIRLRYRKT